MLGFQNAFDSKQCPSKNPNDVGKCNYCAKYFKFPLLHEFPIRWGMTWVCPGCLLEIEGTN